MKVDREAGVVRDVKVIGLKSKNGREYTEAALSGAISLYEGTKVNINHPKGNPGSPRDYQDRFGKLEGLYLKPGDGLYAREFKFNPKHALAEQFAWDAENAPENLGLSHNVEGKTTSRKGSLVVESISKVRAVDLVADPATTSSLFESENTVTLDEILEATKATKSFARSLVEAFGQMAPQMGQTPVPMQAPQPGQPPMAGQQPQVNQQLKSAITALVTAIASDETFSADEIAEKVKQAVEIARGKSGKLPTDDKDPEESEDENMFEDPEKKKKFEESVQAIVAQATQPITEQLEAANKELAARKVLESKGATVNAQLLGELLECEDEDAMKSLVAGWSPQKLGKAKPTVRSLQEQQTAGKFPETHESFLRELKRR